MKVLFVGDSNSRSAGGLYATISATTKALLDKGVDVAFLAYNDAYTREDAKAYGAVPQLCYHTVGLPLLSTLGYSRDIHDLIEEYHPDIIHSQGIWMYHSAAVLRYKKMHPQVKVIVQPHGMLDPWAVKNSGWKKKIVGHLYEYENLRRADCIHALCQSEADAIREFGLKKPIAIIPNGIDLPDCSLDEIIARRQNTLGRKTLLFIGRIHPKKGLRELIEGLAIIKSKNPDLINNWHLKIAGWDQLNHTSELSSLITTLGLDNIVELVGPTFGEQKKTPTRRSRRIHPSKFQRRIAHERARGLGLRHSGCNDSSMQHTRGVQSGCSIQMQSDPGKHCRLSYRLILGLAGKG